MATATLGRRKKYPAVGKDIQVINRGRKVLTFRKGVPQSVIDEVFRASAETDKRREEIEANPMTDAEKSFLDRMSS